MSSLSSEDELPYNPKNCVVTMSDIHAILRQCDIHETVKDISIFQKAFVHKSYCTRKNENFITGNIHKPQDCLPLQEESNERYEFLGDSILNFTVAEYLFARYPTENEGFLTRMRTKLVNGKMLAHLSGIIGFAKYIIISKQIEDSDGRSNLNILEDVFEAFISAVFFDMGMEVAKQWIITVFEYNLDFSELVRSNTNYKDIMLKYFQQNMGYVPRFYEISVTSEGKYRKFSICLKDNLDTIISHGEGKTKKDAENDAAKKAIKRYCPEYTF